MPRRLFKRYMPDPESIRSQKSLRFRQVDARSQPLASQSPLGIARHGRRAVRRLHPDADADAADGRSGGVDSSNLPISVGLVWLTNPITMPPVFYCTYKLGAWLMQVPPRTLPDHLTWEWISQELSSLWQPFLLGSVVCGIIAAILGYALTMLYWRWWVQRSWSRRCRQRRERVAAK